MSQFKMTAVNNNQNTESEKHCLELNTETHIINTLYKNGYVKCSQELHDVNKCSQIMQLTLFFHTIL
jgi:hypothetical protein